MKFSEAQQLAEDPLNGCTVVRGQVQHVWLPPSQLGKVKSGVKEIIEKRLGKYSERLDGIPLAFCNIKIIPRASVLLYDDVDMHLDVKYDVVIFRVIPGSLIKCKVNEVAADHLSCLIHDMINLAVPHPGLNFDLHDPRGLEVVCRVKKIEYKKGIIGISGELTDGSIQKLQEFYVEVKEDYAVTNPVSESLDSSRSSGEEGGEDAVDAEAGIEDRSPSSTAEKIASPTIEDLWSPPPRPETKKKRARKGKKDSASEEIPVAKRQQRGPTRKSREAKDKMAAIGYHKKDSPIMFSSGESDFEVRPKKKRKLKLKSRSVHSLKAPAASGSEITRDLEVDDPRGISADNRLGDNWELGIDPLELSPGRDKTPRRKHASSLAMVSAVSEVPQSGVPATAAVDRTHFGGSGDESSGMVLEKSMTPKTKRKEGKKKKLSLLESDDRLLGNPLDLIGQQQTGGGVEERVEDPLDTEPTTEPKKKRRDDGSEDELDQSFGSPNRHQVGDRFVKGPVTSTAKKRKRKHEKGSRILAEDDLSLPWEDSIASSSQGFEDIQDSAYTLVRRKEELEKKSKKDRYSVTGSGEWKDTSSKEERKKRSKHRPEGHHTTSALSPGEELESPSGDGDLNISPISEDSGTSGGYSMGALQGGEFLAGGKSPDNLLQEKKKSKKSKRKSKAPEILPPERSLDSQTEDINSMWYGFDKSTISRLQGLDHISPGKKKSKQLSTKNVGEGSSKSYSGDGLSSTEHLGSTEYSGAMSSVGNHDVDEVLSPPSELSSGFVEPTKKRKHSKKDKTGPSHVSVRSEGATELTSSFVIPSPAELERLSRKKKTSEKKRKRRTSGASDKTNDSGIQMSRLGSPDVRKARSVLSKRKKTSREKRKGTTPGASDETTTA